MLSDLKSVSKKLRYLRYQIISIHTYRKRILPILEKKLRSFYEILGSKTKLRQFLRNKGVCLGDCKVYGS